MRQCLWSGERSTALRRDSSRLGQLHAVIEEVDWDNWGVERELSCVFLFFCRRGRERRQGKVKLIHIPLEKSRRTMQHRLIGVLLRESSPRALLLKQQCSSVENVRIHALGAVSSYVSSPGALGARFGSRSSSTAAPCSSSTAASTSSSSSSSPSTTFPRPTFDLSESLRECPSDHVITLKSSDGNGGGESKPVTMTISLTAGAALAPAAGAAALASQGSARLLASAIRRDATPGEGRTPTPMPSARQGGCVVDYKERPYAAGHEGVGFGSSFALSGGGGFSAAEADAGAALSAALRCVLLPEDATASALHVSCTLLSGDPNVDPISLALAAAPVAAAAAGARVLAPLAPGRAVVVVPSSSSPSSGSGSSGTAAAFEVVAAPDARQRTAAEADVLVALTSTSSTSSTSLASEPRIAFLDLRAREASPQAVAEATAAATRAAEEALPALEAALADAAARFEASSSLSSPSLSLSRAKQLPPPVPDPAAMAALSAAAGPHIARALEAPALSFAARAAALSAARACALADLRARGAWRLNPMRAPGSGCVCPADVEAGFPTLVAEAVALRASRGLPRAGSGSGAGGGGGSGGAAEDSPVGAWAPRGSRDARDLGVSAEPPLPAAHGSALGGVGEGTRVAAVATVAVDWRASGFAGGSGGGGGGGSSSTSSDPPSSSASAIGPTGLPVTTPRLRAAVARPPFGAVSSFSGGGGGSALGGSPALAPAAAFFGAPPSLASRASGGGGGGGNAGPPGAWWPDRRLASWVERSLAGALSNSDSPASSASPSPPVGGGGGGIGGMPPSVRPPFALRLSLDVLSSDGDPSGAALAAACRAMASAGAPMPREVGSAAAAALRVRGGGGAGSSGGGGGGGDGASRPRGEGDSWELLVDPDAIEASSAAASFNVSSTSRGWTAGRAEFWCPGSLGCPASVAAAGMRAAGGAAAARAAAADAAAARAPRARGRFGAVGLPKEQVGKVIGVGGGVSRALEAQTGGLLAVVDVAAEGGSSSSDVGGRNGRRGGGGGGSPSSSASQSPPASAEARYYAPDQAVEQAMEAAVGNLTGSNVLSGERYKVKVVGLTEYGAFVEFEGGFQALLHISEVSHGRIHSVSEELSTGEEIEVLCTGRDGRGLVQVSRRALLPAAAVASPSPRPAATPFSSSAPPYSLPPSPPPTPRRFGDGDFGGNRRMRSSSGSGSTGSRRSGERSTGGSTGSGGGGGGDRGGDRGSRRSLPSSSSRSGGAAAAASSPSSPRRASPVAPSAKPQEKKKKAAAENENKGGGGGGGGGILGGLFGSRLWGSKS